MTAERSERRDRLPTGPGAAAILAAGIGSLALGVLAFVADAFPSASRALNFWSPTGALSGVTVTAIAVWLLAWHGLWRRWRTLDIGLGPVNRAAFLMLAAALLLTFPPFADLLQGR